MADEYNLDLFEVSAKENINIDEVFEKITTEVFKVLPKP